MKTDPQKNSDPEIHSEVADRGASFSRIRYAQSWEDADILLPALNVGPGKTCLSIASAGDNSLALLSRNPEKVVALDLSDAQLTCVALRRAAYNCLEHEELLNLLGSAKWTAGKNEAAESAACRRELLIKCRPALDENTFDFWNNHDQAMQLGVGHAGKFENYFATFRRRVIPLIHNRQRIDGLFAGRDLQSRRKYYETTWNNRRWRWLFRLFFSRTVMGRMGRDPEFFAFVEGSVADRILERTRYALTELDPRDNPYLQWILRGFHDTARPLALRAEVFDSIGKYLDRLEVHNKSLETFLDNQEADSIDCFNLSDIFEYMSEEGYHQLLRKIIRVARPGARLVYWNMLVPRSRPEILAASLKPLPELAESLFRQDKAWFYSAFVVEEVIK